MTQVKHNLFIVGPMGSGKTTIGRKVAEILGLTFYDLDETLEARTGASIQLIFDIEGESGFRKRETELLEELSQLQGVLLATGGGTILRPANRNILRSSGVVVYLNTSVEQQLRRLERDKRRPLLQQPDRESLLEKLAVQRNPLYEAVADIQLTSSDRSLTYSAHHVAEAILEYLAELPGVQHADH